jgi:hypothetical protein
MMANSGTYQSGREVFENFIPNYTTPRLPNDRPILECLPNCSATEFVEKLLNDFSHQLSNVSKLNDQK